MANEPRSVSVGLTAIRVCQALPRRTSLLFKNNSTTATVYYGRSNQLTVDNGMTIPPSGSIGFLRQLGDRPDLEYWLVADTAGTDVRIDESTEPVNGGVSDASD